MVHTKDELKQRGQAKKTPETKQNPVYCKNLFACVRKAKPQRNSWEQAIEDMSIKQVMFLGETGLDSSANHEHNPEMFECRNFENHSCGSNSKTGNAESNHTALLKTGWAKMNWKKKRKRKQRSARGFKNARAHTLGERERRARIWISELERRCVENQTGHPGEELPERAFCREEALHRAAGHQRGSLQKAALLQKRSSQTQLTEKQEKCEKEQLGSKKERSGPEEIRECKRSKRMRNSGRTRETATAGRPLKDYSPHINISPSSPSATRDRTI